MPDLDWSFPPPTGPIEDDHLRALMQRTGLFLGELPSTLAPHVGKLVRVRLDASGWEYTPGITSMTRVVRSITGDTLLSADIADDRQASDGSLERGLILVRHATPSTAITITVPATAAPGTVWTLVQAIDQTGTVTIAPQSGATLHGQTGAITMDGPGAVAALLVVANSGGSAAAVIVAGATSLGQALTGVTDLGEIRGHYLSLGAAITSNVTLGTADRGTERRITASSTVTITVPSGFRGHVYLRNVSSVSHTVALTGVGNKTLAAGYLGIVDGNGTDLGLRTSAYA